GHRRGWRPVRRVVPPGDPAGSPGSHGWRRCRACSWLSLTDGGVRTFGKAETGPGTPLMIVVPAPATRMFLVRPDAGTPGPDPRKPIRDAFRRAGSRPPPPRGSTPGWQDR